MLDLLRAALVIGVTAWLLGTAFNCPITVTVGASTWVLTAGAPR